MSNFTKKWQIFWAQKLLNVLPVIGYPGYAQRIMGSSGGKHCELLEGNVLRKVVSTSKKAIWRRDQHFFAIVLSKMYFSNVDTRKFKFLVFE